MDAAKIQLSSAEMALASDPSWILTKNSIMGKAVALMAELSGEFRAEWDNSILPAGGNGGNDPKISKGENYKGLPYVILDYPRHFGREDVFAIRTMFWWGHSFHVTLHLKGKYQAMFLPVIRQRLSMLAAAGFQVAVSEDEWQHELSPENYRPFGALVTPGKDLPGSPSPAGGESPDLDGLPFLKLAAPCPLDKWNDAPSVLLELFRVLIRALG